ncbi:MAG TPA: PSD1 and planctomycete cytochrome C domain-containing protein [Pirellulales bacterium]|jgi:hypothetical protein|nr:PSD1 and planctomycete cytochrome C domain-containing protein [Pirellulales bacterium]
MKFLVIFVAVLASASLAFAEAPTSKAKNAPGHRVDFARDVYPILKRSCFECHGPEKQEGGLRLDRRDDFNRGGDSGPAIVVGKAAQSELIARVILPDGDDSIMPARGARLSQTSVRTLRDWINQGATWPEQFDEAPHWAYVVPRRPKPPEVQRTGWARNAIDRFILDRLEESKLQPSEEADRATLLRRVTLDLTGIPPSPDEIEAFLSDTSPKAYENAVDRLLDSPQFGVRWARPWLDAARYADSHGFQRDDLYSIWAYRDWVVNALNADMPFDRFTTEQIAGDLLPDATNDQKIATGFNRCAPTNVEAGSDPEETRVNQVLDRVNTTAAVWLGSTLECAQCHDHKYDPFTQREYYGLFAFFNNTAIEADRSNPTVPGSIRFLGPMMPLPDVEHAAERAELTKELARIDRQLEARRGELQADLETWAEELSTASKRESEVFPLEVIDFDSSAGSPHQKLDDGSILLVDDAPDIDTYTVTVRTDAADITGFKLETLTHDSLPGKGPGRGDAERPNFVLNSITVEQISAKGKPRPVKLKNAQADFSQKNWDVEGLTDDNPKTGWAIGGGFHEPHWATFETDKPLGDKTGAKFVFTLVQKFGSGRTIGCFRLSALTGNLKAKELPEDVLKILMLSVAKRTIKHTNRLLAFRSEQDEAMKTLETERKKVDRKLKGVAAPTTLVMEELDAPRGSTVFMRGDFRNPGKSVEPTTPEVLHAMPAGERNRLTLARWLVDRNNPLVARVTVNRWWADLFGHGIVTTVEDFGIKGEPPTHPELLDWLAVEFMDRGWSMKHMLRTIVMSATYRQSSRITPELLAVDDQNLLYARGPRFRMDAEMIRDNALASSGLLSFEHGGPSIRPYQPEGLWTKVGGQKVEYAISPGEQRYRRGIYVVWKRGAPYPSFVNFDASARMACKLKRSRSNTPLQALTLLNDPVYVEAAMALAKRVLVEREGADLDAKLKYAFELCLTRTPRSHELEALRRLYEEQRSAGRSDADGAKALIDGFAIPKGTDAAEFAAWYAVATALLNLDEMITKG